MIRNVTRYGIAVRAGQFQPQRIEFDARGKSTVTPLAPFVDSQWPPTPVRRAWGVPSSRQSGAESPYHISQRDRAIAQAPQVLSRLPSRGGIAVKRETEEKK